jgi:hypothetical protein
MTDPTVLYSTAAQATAALVGIVGGFLVSRLVALSSERSSLVQRAGELQSSLDLATKHWEQLHSERLRVSKKWFEDRHFDDFIGVRGNVDTEAEARWIPVGSSVEEMRPVAESLAQRIKLAFEKVSDAYRAAEYPSTDIEQLRLRIPDIADEDVRIFEEAAAQLADERGQGRLSGMGGFSLPRRRLVSPALTNVATSDVVVQRQEGRVRDERDALAKVEALRHELGYVKGEIRRFGSPEGVGSGIATLVYFSLVGIALPMILMSLSPVPSDPWVRIVAIGTFGSGLVVLLVYIGRLVQKLKPPK